MWGVSAGCRQLRHGKASQNWARWCSHVLHWRGLLDGCSAAQEDEVVAAMRAAGRIYQSQEGRDEASLWKGTWQVLLRVTRWSPIGCAPALLFWTRCECGAFEAARSALLCLGCLGSLPSSSMAWVYFNIYKLWKISILLYSKWKASIRLIPKLF